ncbi:MAG: hypothetical protein ACYS8Z_26755 [Planctomycetota bacterium]|jgi:hypothetical protein
MGFFSNLFSKAEPQSKQPEHAFIVQLKLSNDDFGTEEERNTIHNLSDKLSAAIDSAGVGEFDGDEFGGGTCTLYMYGPDADALFATVDPVLRSSTLSKGATAVKRYGEATDPDAKEEKVQY